MIDKSISHYKIIEKIGAGGMGVIYKAQDLKLDRFVALKFLPPHLTTSEEEKQRFIHEAKAASSLDHNNICAIHEIDETDDGQLFISMAYYEGETLHDRFEGARRAVPTSIPETIDVAIQIAQGLAKAHEKEIVHRDIKPANIMLTKEGVVKVLDFGLAKLSTQTKLTKESTTLGTVSYMSPEQAKGEEVDYRTDIWSLGVILYEMLTGQLPFKGEYESAVIYSIMNDTQEPVTGLRTGVPMELERIINKCLQKSSADRYQYLDELIVDLRSMKRDSETSSIPTNEVTQKKRSKLALLSVAILSILILMVVGYLLIQPYWKSGTGWESSIAVLPFDDLSPEGDQGWFCNGMTEQIITNLSKIKRLKVIGRTSIIKFKKTNKTLPEIGQELNVSHILKGSIRKHEDNIRVTAQLISSEDGSHLWADDFDRKLDDVFWVQDNVSEEIATILLTTLSPQEKKDIKTKRPSSTEAYEYYMKGKHFHIKYYESKDIEDFYKSEKMYKTAIQLDPNFADSYADLSDLYNVHYFSLPDTASERDKFLQLQEAYLDSAYRLDPNSAAVNQAKGWVHLAKNEIDDAFHSLKTAISINPNHEQYYLSMSGFLRARGCYRLGIKCLTRAIEIDPLFSLLYRERGQLYMILGEYTEAERDIINASEIEHTLAGERLNYWLLLCKEQYKDANKYLTKLKTEYPDQTFNREQGVLYAVEGNKEEAFNTVSNTYELKNDLGYNMTLFTLLDSTEAAINLFEKTLKGSMKSKHSLYLNINTDPIFDNIRSDPRFQEILAKHKEIYEENLEKYGDIDI